MKKFLNFVVNRHQDITRYAIVVAAIAIISYFFPRTGVFKYEYEIGKPWKYESLLAPFDFGIEKTEKEIEEEKAAAFEDFVPYYKIDSTVYIDKINRFVKRFNEEYSIMKAASFNTMVIDSAINSSYGLKLLNTIYDKGIISLTDEHKNFAPNKEISLLKGENTAELKRLSDFYTVKSAYQIIANVLSKPPHNVNPQFMRPLIEQSIDYNIFYDDSLSQKFQHDLLDKISLTRGMVQEGEMILSKGTIVTDVKYLILQSFESEYNKRILGIKKSQIVYFGNVLLTGLIIVVFMIFVFAFSEEIFKSTQKIFFIFVITTIVVVLVSTLVKTDLPIQYAIPVCIVPIVLRNFFGARLALHAHIMLVLLIAFIVPIGLEYTFLHLIAGMVAIFTNIKAFYWTQFFTSNAFILLTYVTGYFAISIIQEGTFENFNYSNFGWLALNSLLLFLSYPLITIFEKTFGFISELTLLELSDINKPLLKELSIKAPGTFQHSLQVANLSEAAAYEVGANTLLVKVGALYHDIGKMAQPMYFVENQKKGNNPHTDLSPKKSAEIIINHVRGGIEMAKKNNLPDILIDFIRTHHGTTYVEYFMHKHKNMHPNEKFDDSSFQYPGPQPYSKETAIVMMADTVEAAARSLDDPTDKDINELVDRLVQHKIDRGQFNNCNVTFKEITLIKKVLKKMLHSIYHVRVAYPGQ